MRKCKTIEIEGVIPKEVADHLYKKFKYGMKWNTSVKVIYPGDIKFVDEIIEKCVQYTPCEYFINQTDVYNTVYEHSIKRTSDDDRLIVVLGGKRNIRVGKTTYRLSSGDAIIFGRSDLKIEYNKYERNSILLVVSMSRF